MPVERLLRVESLKKYFSIRSGIRGSKRYVKAVDDISFEVDVNNVFAIVGESGSGKSTVANLILRLIEPTDGHIYFKGLDILLLKGEELLKFRKSAQIIFQDPFASLNPRMRIIDILSEPFNIHKIIDRSRIKERILQLLETVGMGADALNKYPHEFSGGQRQRICIARALTVSPELIIADEPLSALDVSIQAQILNLFQKIKQDLTISFIFISHDLKVVRYFSDKVAVMYLGKFVEMAKSEDLFSMPLHPYTRLLIASAPKIITKKNSVLKKSLLLKQGSLDYIQSTFDVPSGCPFHPRCPEKMDICLKEVPLIRDYGGRSVACHLYGSC